MTQDTPFLTLSILLIIEYGKNKKNTNSKISTRPDPKPLARAIGHVDFSCPLALTKFYPQV